ncbi:FAD-binding protein [Amycolatopsis jejuensis]|uniref:FAD-binding protein n=1 Tax=Amycolatopsis jejuensis TaxID=330084 RepID=UPI0005241AB9|nr:FAD-binding protein [Amycolatopsis jejuensis]
MLARNGPLTVVCIKQVPVAAAVEFDAETGTLRRDGIPAEVNSHDVRALLSALAVRERCGGSVVVVTMGPPDAASALRYCLALGADRAIHLCDKAFAGSDTLATARALALAIGREEPDVVLCGRSSTDAETGNVGPEIAELLGWPQVTGVCAWELGDTVVARREVDDGFEQVSVTTPAVLVVGEDVAEERFPSREARSAAASMPLEVVGVTDLGADPALFGAAGSPTVVTSVQEQPGVKRANVILDDSASAQADAIVEWLSAHGSSGGDRRLPAPETVRTEGSSIAVYVETGPDGITQVSRELLAAASGLGRVDAVLIGDRKHCAELVAYGADRVLHIDAAGYDTLVHTAFVVDVIRAYAPRVMLFPSTGRGRDLAPRLAARLGLGLTADCVGLHFSRGQLVQHKPAFGDGLLAMITSRTSPELATVRPGVFSSFLPRWDRPVRVERLALDHRPSRGYTVLKEIPGLRRSTVDLFGADIVLGVGMGAAGVLPEVERLAGLLGAGVACTRKLADTGALPRHAQVGLTGCSVSPRIYVAIGVRGAYEHVVGLSRAEHVLAIDIDEDSFMFDHADLGVVQDCGILLPLLAQRLSLLEEQCTHA